jgi:hypothetical protein
LIANGDIKCCITKRAYETVQILIASASTKSHSISSFGYTKDIPGMLSQGSVQLLVLRN